MNTPCRFCFGKVLLFALSPLLLLWTAAGAPPPVTPAPALLPDPPRQNDPWTPPATTLPPEFVAATKTLFREGLADPRGGEYREITVQASGFFPGMTSPVRVHGWVLPTGPGTAPSFAVCWNGEVYPVTAVGVPADLKADAGAMARGGSFRGNIVQFEDQAISPASFSPLKACLLLRLGEAPLAEQVWAAQSPSLRDGDPSLRLASEWTWGLLCRVVDARQRGDDPFALFLARRLTRIRARVEGDAAERHLPYPTEPDSGPQTMSRAYLPSLDFLPELLADEEVRAHAPARPLALSAGEKAFVDKNAYIAALIGDLDQVRPNGWSGSTPSVGNDPIVRALVDQGDAAVEPLIHAVATDTRLLRFMWVDPFHPRFYPARASRVAFTAAATILQFSAFGDGGYRDADPPGTAAALQRYWDKYKGLPLAERWYGTLANDRATPQQWQEAADAIVRPANVTSLGNGATSWTPQPGIVFPLRGEPLRARFGPAVSLLMARRIPQIAAVDRKRPWTGAGNVHNATLMALDAARWDARASVPALRAQADHLSGLPTTGYYADPQIAEDEAAVALARVRGGDTQALNSYVAWLMTGPLPAWASVQAFEPLWRFPRDPSATAAAARLFGGSAPSWLPALSDRNSPALGDFLESPLLGMTAFRESFLVALRDKTVVGNLKVNEHGWQSETVAGMRGYDTSNDAIVDPLRPKTPWTLAVRRCDLYAWHLSQLGGLPRFEFYWSQPKRDAAIAQAADRLRRYGPRFEYQPSLEALWSQDARYTHAPGLGSLWSAFNSPRALLAFLRLGHPATPAEAARGAAIFSLAGLGARRVWPLPQWPLPARWVTDRRYPQTGPFLNGKPTVGYQQDGLVWQTEEVWQGGQWRRFYGFVGPHDIARVPADQIEFPPDNPYLWQSFSPALDGKASLPEDKHRLPVGTPLPVTLLLRCRSSREQGIPAEWVRMGPDGPALREGLTLRLSYSPGPSFPGVGDAEAEMRRVWTLLTPTQTAAFAPTPAVRRLTPAQEMQALQLDLRDWYDLSRPGSYRLAFEFDDKRSGLGDGHTLSLWFELTQ